MSNTTAPRGANGEQGCIPAIALWEETAMLSSDSYITKVLSRILQCSQVLQHNLSWQEDRCRLTSPGTGENTRSTWHSRSFTFLSAISGNSAQCLKALPPFMTLPDSSEELELLLTSGMTEVYAGVGGFLAYDLLT
ncbi:hypothetical protein DV515_00006209 [Chloebia gouldiae]|uniref:Uncharacterized protein n=1 Tax=Chloebia gouldiae TaxID=44316 RepID=A0A3L8SKS1_CHLGU|nr:hypothetical protein DV515_00006209 [Chloebia gouldiae]